MCHDSGRVISIEPTSSGYVMEVMNQRGAHVYGFIHSDWFLRHEKVKPNQEVRIRFSKGYTVYGSDIFHIDSILPICRKKVA